MTTKKEILQSEIEINDGVMMGDTIESCNEFVVGLKKTLEPLLPLLVERKGILNYPNAFYVSWAYSTNTSINIATFEEYEQLRAATRFLVENASSVYSKKTLASKLDAALHQIINDSTQIDTVLAELWDDVKEMPPDEWSAYAQLENINLDNGTYHILDTYIKILDKGDFSKKMPSIQRHHNFCSKPCIFTQVKAVELAKAKELAFEKFRYSVDLIRLYYPDLSIRIIGTEVTGMSNYYLYNVSKKLWCVSSKEIRQAKRDRRGESIAVFTQSMYDELMRRGIDSLNEKNTVSDKVKMGLHWFGLGLDELSPSARLVAFVIVLECILKRENEYEKLGNILKKRYSSLVGNNNLERRAISKNVYNIYNERGNVVHRGHIQIEPAISELAKEYAREALMKLIEYSQTQKPYDTFLDELDKRGS